MSDFPPRFYATIRGIDRFTDVTGKLISLAMLFLVFSISYECFSRYLLDAPTIWVMDTSYIANGSAFMLGCGYAMLKGAHVRTDMLWDKYSERKKGAIDLGSYLLLFFPVMITFLVISVTTRGTRSRSARPPSNRRGARSCGRSAPRCRSPPCSS
jgi:TRAP-type mannitol/chloroaromatic compound transport system permease small subunit